MGFERLRRSCFDPLPPQTKTPRIIGDRASPYHAAPYVSGLREMCTPRTGASGNKVRRLTRPSTSGSARCPARSRQPPPPLLIVCNAHRGADRPRVPGRPSKRLGLQADGDDLERKGMPPPFQSSVVSMVADLRDKTLTGESASVCVLGEHVLRPCRSGGVSDRMQVSVLMLANFVLALTRVMNA
jgi:hypothetical protein